MAGLLEYIELPKKLGLPVCSGTGLWAPQSIQNCAQKNKLLWNAFSSLTFRMSVVQKVGVDAGLFVINREIMNIPIWYLCSLSVWVLRYKPRPHASTDDGSLWRSLHVGLPPCRSPFAGRRICCFLSVLGGSITELGYIPLFGVILVSDTLVQWLKSFQ